MVGAASCLLVHLIQIAEPSQRQGTPRDVVIHDLGGIGHAVGYLEVEVTARSQSQGLTGHRDLHHVPLNRIGRGDRQTLAREIGVGQGLADNDFAHLSGEALKEAIKSEITKKDDDLVGKMASEGTTPRRLTDLIGSLCDLTSGSGDKGTPIVFIQGYFDNYTTE